MGPSKVGQMWKATGPPLAKAAITKDGAFPCRPTVFAYVGYCLMQMHITSCKSK